MDPLCIPHFPSYGRSLSSGGGARALFLASQELGPLLDCVQEDGEWQAVVAMRDHLRELYMDKPPRGDLRAAEVTRAYRAHCCKEACRSNYLLYLEEDGTEAVANACHLGVGLRAVCADVVESLNAILKRTYHDHSGRGGGGDAGGNPTRTGGGGSLTSVGVVVFKF